MIAATSLAIRTGEKTKRVFDFWDATQGAPAEIRDIKAELELLQHVLKQVSHEASHQADDSSTVTALEICSWKKDSIQAITAAFETGLVCSKTRTRKWSAIQAVFKGQKIKKLHDSLTRLKGTLTLGLL